MKNNYICVVVLIISIAINIALGVYTGVIKNEISEFKTTLLMDEDNLFEDGIVFIKRDDGSAMIVDNYKVESGNTVIPQTLNGCTVKEIY